MKCVKVLTIFFAVICVSRIGAAQEDPEFDPVCSDEDAFIPHEDCTKYYLCSNGVPTLQECPGGLYFNPKINACDFDFNVPECKGGTRPPPGSSTTSRPTQTPPTSPEVSTTDFPIVTTDDPSTPSNPSTTEAPSTSSNPGTTDSGTDAPTTQSPPETTQSPPETTQSPPETTTQFSCPPTGIHDFPYPGNCSLFYRCIFGSSIVESCAEGLLFDKNDRICKPAADAVCEEEPPTTSAPITDEPTTEPPEFNCPPTGYDTFPHPSNCSLYYLCFNGNLFTEQCAFGTYYDADVSVKRCNLAELVHCNAECPAEGIHYLPIPTSTCRHYKICVDGESVNLSCSEGTIYNPERQQCVTLDSYTCPYADFHSGF